MPDIIMRSQLPADAWNDAADRFDTAWAWHHGLLLDARATWTGTEDHSFAVIDRANNDQVLALVPLVHVRAGRVPGLLGGHLESTGGPALDAAMPHKTGQKTLQAIRVRLQYVAAATGARRLDMSAPPQAPQQRQATGAMVNPFCHLGAADRSTQSWILSLAGQDEDSLWRNLEHRSRKEINKARKHALTVEAVTPSPDMLAHYYALHQETCARNGIPPHPRAYFAQIFGPLADAGISRLWQVRQGDQVVAMLNFLIYKNTALYWTTACSGDALLLSANDFGIWQAILDLSRQGIEALECGEAFPGATAGKLKGLNDFKKSFGGDLHPYFRGQIIYRPRLESLIDMARHLKTRG